MSIEIESADVIRLIQQFLKESNLTKTLLCLQQESGIKVKSNFQHKQFQLINVKCFFSKIPSILWKALYRI